MAYIYIYIHTHTCIHKYMYTHTLIAATSSGFMIFPLLGLCSITNSNFSMETILSESELHSFSEAIYISGESICLSCDTCHTCVHACMYVLCYLCVYIYTYTYLHYVSVCLSCNTCHTCMHA